jgi:aspartate dehydrogenase
MSGGRSRGMSSRIRRAGARSPPSRHVTGTAREAAAHCPRHFDVAVSLSLAGVGLGRTLVDIAADGRLPDARHTIHVKSPAVTLEMTSYNLPSPENNRTSRIVAPSILAALPALPAPLRVGS